MAIIKRQHSSGSTYYMTDLRVNARRVREYAGTKLKGAQDVEADRKLAIRAGTYLPPGERVQVEAEPESAPDPGPTFREFIESRFLPEYAKLRRSDYYEQIVKPLITFFGDMPLREIRRTDVDRYRLQRMEAFRKKNGREISQGTMRKELMVLGTVYTTARRWECVEGNPAADVVKPREPKHKLLYLTNEEGLRFAAELPAWARPMAGLALATGMRLLEVVSLRWRDLDKQGGIITIREGKTELREIPMGPGLRRAFDAQPIRGEYVFTDDKGLPYTSTRERNRISQVTSSAMHRAGVAGGGFHTLRHTAASWMVQAGTPLYEVQRVLGHKDPKMTMRYAHLAPGHLSGALGSIASVVDTYWTPTPLLSAPEVHA